MNRQAKLTNNRSLFSVMIILFFIWGFITLLNDLLIPVLRNRLNLDYSQALLVQFVFFITYFVMSLPMASILNRTNYKKSIIFGLSIISVGCFIFVPADLQIVYWVFLLGLFVLASGVVMLQVSANPMVTLLGDERTASARLTLAQGINSLGYALAPWILGGVITSSTHIYVPYVIIAVIMVLVAILIRYSNFRAVDGQLALENLAQADLVESDKELLWHNKVFLIGLFGIFFYVGAEVTAGSLIVSFLHLPHIANFSLLKAAKFLTVFWGGAMVGRLVGSYILSIFKPANVLIVAALMNVLLLCGVIFATGYSSMWCLLLLGVFNSIMFPTIFALSISNLSSDHLKNKASGYLIMSIVGGAVIPEIQGLIADVIGLQHSFFLLYLSYIYIMVFAIFMSARKSTVQRT